METKTKYFCTPTECIRSFKSTLATTPKVSKISVLERITPVLAEKVMLAVIGVNRNLNRSVNRNLNCINNYVKIALQKGVSQEQIDVLLTRDLVGIPNDELPAIKYAQLWAYKSGDLPSDLRKKVVKAYGEKAAFHIDILIKRANFTSLCNNTICVVKDNWKHGKRDLKSSLSYILCLLLSMCSRRKA